MAQNFDFFVSAIRYNSDNTHIQTLKVHKTTDNGISFYEGVFVEMTRPQVIEEIKKKKTFSSIVKKANGEWVLGSPLEIIPVMTEYLKTKKDSSTRDNLENLPTF